MNEKITTPDYYDFDMSLYMGEGWSLFKKGAGSFIGFTILYFVMMLIMTFIPFVNLIGNVISYVLIAGVYVFCRNLLNKKDDFGQFFAGFNYFGQIFLFFLMILVFMIPVIIIIFTMIFPAGLFSDLISGQTNYQELIREISMSIESNAGYFGLLYFIILLIMCYVYISYSFALPLIVDGGLSFWDAMETSRKTVAKKFFSFFGMYLILVVLCIAGATITCGMGLVVLLPYFGCVIFSAYDNILNPQKDTLTSQIEEFGKEIKDTNTEEEDKENNQ